MDHAKRIGEKSQVVHLFYFILFAFLGLYIYIYINMFSSLQWFVLALKVFAFCFLVWMKIFFIKKYWHYAPKCTKIDRYINYYACDLVP